MTSLDPLEIAIRAPAFLLGIGMHEWSHAFVADRAGDPTPRAQGRLSLNPLVHLDPVGTLCILFAPIGWGRPVEVQPANFDDPARDHVRVALAGPLMNLLLAALGLVLLDVFVQYLAPGLPGHAWKINVRDMLWTIVVLNTVLALFNLLPLPPLDGSRVAAYHLGERGAGGMSGLQAGGGAMLILLLVMSGALEPLFIGGFQALGRVRGLGLGAELAAVAALLVLWLANAGLLRPRR